MKRKLAAAAFIMLACLLASLPAMAADVFRFTSSAVTVLTGETFTPELLQDGKYADGEVVWTVTGNKCSVDESGTITGVAPGQSTVSAALKQDGKTVRSAKITVTVARKVAKVTLDTSKLQVYEPDDAKILALMKRGPEDEPPEDRILFMYVHGGFYPQISITPDDVRYGDKRVTYESSDTGIVKYYDNRIRAVQAGECDLVIRSVQSPEVFEKFHVFVGTSATQVKVTAPLKTVPIGRAMQLSAEVLPAEATFRDVIWTSRNPKIATVDANGMVAGVAKGSVYIDATATDGSKKVGSFYLTVVQSVEEITIKETDVTVATGRSASALHCTVLPKTATNKSLTWYSSDETIATVRGGVVTGRKAGECFVTCASVTNPEVTASIPVHVIQLVKDITFTTPKGLSFYIGESRQLEWQIAPEDASIQAVTFKSRAPKVAVVDQNGIVTGLAKGQANIEVRATDGSGKYRVYTVTILKAVEGIEPLAYQYFAQLGRNVTIRTNVLPKDASNQKILWSGNDDYIASVTSAGVNTARIYGRRRGSFQLTGVTDDGGFPTSTTVIVDDFDGLVACTSVYVDNNNKIRLQFYNMSRDYTVRKVYFKVDCYDTQGQKMICNTDNESTWFNGNYPLPLEPGRPTEHGRFNFTDYKETGYLGYVVATITGFEFDNGQRWNIPADNQYPQRSPDSSHMGEPIPNSGNTEEGNG